MFGENPTNTFQDIVLRSPESAVSSILYSTVTLTFDLLTPNCPIVHHRCKFGENVLNTRQDIMLTMFRDAHTADGHTHACTDEEDKHSMSSDTLRWRRHKN